MIKTVSPDILHAHSSFFARVAARLSGIDKPRIVYTKHCVFDSPRIVKSKLFKKAYATIDQMFCGRIVAVADCAKEKLAEYGIDPDRVTVIINGVEPLEKISEPEKLKIREELNILESLQPKTQEELEELANKLEPKFNLGRSYGNIRKSIIRQYLLNQLLTNLR